jgi:hypothetical protein
MPAAVATSSAAAIAATSSVPAIGARDSAENAATKRAVASGATPIADQTAATTARSRRETSATQCGTAAATRPHSASPSPRRRVSSRLLRSPHRLPQAPPPQS